MTNADIVKNVNDLRRKIENLGSVGSKQNAAWLEKVLELSDKTAPHESKIIGPRDHLDKANYTDVVERDYGPPIKTIRICVTSKDELEKCRDLSRGAFSRNVRPRFDCINQRDVEGCLRTIRDNGADIITIDAALTEKAQRKYNLRPIVAEKYNSSADGSFYVVAVVRKSSIFRSFQDLKGAKACFTRYDGVGVTSPLSVLLQQGLIKADDCPRDRALANFFGSSCMPGANSVRDRLELNVMEKLCALCQGDGSDPSTKCFENVEIRRGDVGAFKCLVEVNGGDVAFVRQDSLFEGEL